MKEYLCLYHQDCIDGYASAWVVGHACGFENVEFVPVGHGKELPSMAGRYVYMVDFLPNAPSDIPVETLKDMAKAKRLVILDHHASAYENWKDTPLLEHWTYRYEPDLSGVGVTWRYFFGANKPMPLPLRLIQNRDLWNFELALTREFHAVAVSHGLLNELPKEDVWRALQTELDSDLIDERWYVRNDHIRIEGAAILRDQKNYLHTLLKRARLIKVLEYQVPICQVPYDLRSDAAFWLGAKYPFSITYDDMWNEGLRRYSIRSNKKTGINVIPIAEAFGGGGHKHAAAFTTSVDEKLLFWIPPSNGLFQMKLDLGI